MSLRVSFPLFFVAANLFLAALSTGHRRAMLNPAQLPASRAARRMESILILRPALTPVQLAIAVTSGLNGPMPLEQCARYSSPFPTETRIQRLRYGIR